MPGFCCYNCCRPQKKVIEKRLNAMYQELDIVRFIKSQKQVRLALKTIFTRLEYILLLNQKVFVINHDSDESDASDAKS